MFREQYIYAKYQRKEFVKAREPLSSYLTGKYTIYVTTREVSREECL